MRNGLCYGDDLKNIGYNFFQKETEFANRILL